MLQEESKNEVQNIKMLGKDKDKKEPSVQTLHQKEKKVGTDNNA